MSQMKNKVKWCLNKAEREIKSGSLHRGLVKIEPNLQLAREHIAKAEHYLKASEHLKKGNFSDISASTIFYSMYHCLLAISAKEGYESRNQECTFALISSLIEENKIFFDKEMLDKIASFDVEKTAELTSIKIREQYQYGTSLSLQDNIYNEIFLLAQQVLDKTKTIIEE